MHSINPKPLWHWAVAVTGTNSLTYLRAGMYERSMPGMQEATLVAISSCRFAAAHMATAAVRVISMTCKVSAIAEQLAGQLLNGPRMPLCSLHEITQPLNRRLLCVLSQLYN